MSYGFLPYSSMNQPQVNICPLSLEPPSHHLGCQSTSLSSLLYNFPLAICFTQAKVCAFCL